MSILFAPTNAYYGENNGYRMCHNGPDPEKIKRCEAGEPVWYSAWGYNEDGKIHARLTYNPHFESMIATISTVMAAQ